MSKKKPTWPHSRQVRELLLAFLEMASRTKKPYAIGGALAMSAHGYVRQTSDVDAFLLLEHRREWLAAARAQGLAVEEIFRDVHYVAFLRKHADPGIRIDLLFPADEPDLSAVEFSETASIGGIEAEVFPLDLLAMAKFQSDRPEDAHDFDKMFDLGMVDVARVHGIIASVDTEQAARFAARVAELSRPRKNTWADRSRPGPSKRIKRNP